MHACWLRLLLLVLLPGTMLPVTQNHQTAWSQGLDPSKALTQYTYDMWRMKEGLPHNTVADILQE